MAQRPALRIANTFQVLQDNMALVLVGDEHLAGVALQFTNPVVAGRIFLHEFMLRSLWRLFDWLVGGNQAIARFDFAFPVPQDADSYGEFFSGPVAFGQPWPGLRRRTASW